MNKRTVKEKMTTLISDEPNQDNLVRWAIEEFGNTYTQAEYTAMAEEVSTKWYRADERNRKRHQYR